MSEVEHIHGYPILLAEPAKGGHVDRPGRIVLVDRGPDHGHRWVTGWLGDGDDQWTWGHYFLGETAARDDYAYRCRRGY